MMTKAVFWIDKGNYIGFEISGHSGNDVAGKDIVCAAISAMTMLTVNTICEVYKQKAITTSDEKKAIISFRLKNTDAASVGLLQGFYEELVSLKKEYPKNLSIKTEKF